MLKNGWATSEQKEMNKVIKKNKTKRTVHKWHK